jgi:hypothetical protein
MGALSARGKAAAQRRQAELDAAGERVGRDRGMGGYLAGWAGD